VAVVYAVAGNDVADEKSQIIASPRKLAQQQLSVFI
jgi:hypothetical protein